MRFCGDKSLAETQRANHAKDYIVGEPNINQYDG
jgi:hypothetical protein